MNEKTTVVRVEVPILNTIVWLVVLWNVLKFLGKYGIATVAVIVAAVFVTWGLTKPPRPFYLDHLDRYLNPTAVPATPKNEDELKADAELQAAAAKAQQERELEEARLQKDREAERARLKTEADAKAKEVRVPAILAELKSPDAKLRKEALRDIGMLGDRATEAVDDLVRLLADSPSRDPAANALAAVGKPAVPAVLKGLKSPNLFVRLYCARVLGEIGPDASAAAATLRSLAVNDPSLSVREEAAGAAKKVAPKK